jgi:hypothetical protein
MSNQRGTSGTATRDVIINEKSETRFGLWVRRIQDEIAEAITMFINMYQDWAPPTLGDRVLGKDGRKIFKNLSVKTLRGNYDARLTPDIHMGSKTFKRQIMAQTMDMLQNSVWIHPQVNPKGNYNLTGDTIKEMMGEVDVERYLGKAPEGPLGDIKDVEDEWTVLMQGDKIIPPPEGPTAMAIQHLIGHQIQKSEKEHELAEEYRPNLDEHILATLLNVRKFIKISQESQAADKMAVGELRWQDPEYRRKVIEGLKGKTAWNKGIPRTQETKDKLRLKHLGKKHSAETKRKMSLAHGGTGLSKNHKLKIKNSVNTGRFKKGHRVSPKTEFKEGNIPWATNKKRPDVTGEKNPSWKDGRTPLVHLIRNSIEYIEWRTLILQLDDYTCQDCGQIGGDLEVHHDEKPFIVIFNEFLKDFDQFSPVEDKRILIRLAINYKPFWDIGNGETLCIECHNETKKKKDTIQNAEATGQPPQL